MSLTGNPKHWTVTDYTGGTWTDLVAEAGDVVVAAIAIANTGASPAAVSLRLATGAGEAISVILPPAEIAAGAAQALDLRSLSLPAGTKLQMQADLAGVHVTASGTT